MLTHLVRSRLTETNVVVVIKTLASTMSHLVWGANLSGGAVALAQFNSPPVRYAGQEDFLSLWDNYLQITQFPPKYGKNDASQPKTGEKYLIYSLYII